MATIIKQTKEEINWAEIARAREMGVLDKLLAERDVIRFNLRSGAEVAVMVEKVEPGRVWMGFVDGVAERPMYNRLARPVSWKESDARKWCNTDLVQDLPEELVAIITPRTIRKSVREMVEISHSAEEASQLSKKKLSDRERAETIARLEKEMKAASKMLEFEYAALLRDQIIELRGGK